MNEELKKCSQSKAQINHQRIRFHFHEPGVVKASRSNVRNEEIFLCERLTEDLQKCIFKSKTYWYSWNNPVMSVLQGMKRPVCGLVALCMAGQMLQEKDSSIELYTDSEVLEYAQKNGYTLQGEMFSAAEYAQLASKLYKCASVVNEYPLVNSLSTIIRHLAQGLPVLVPYDTDRNYEPCMRDGHKAHWAIITGFVVGCSTKLRGKFESNGGIVVSVDDPLVFHSPEFLSSKLDPSLVYVYAKQGKSARQQLWPLTCLSASNANLNEADPSRDFDHFKIPKGGIKNTLSTKSVLLYPRNGVN